MFRGLALPLPDVSAPPLLPPGSLSVACIGGQPVCLDCDCVCAFLTRHATDPRAETAVARPPGARRHAVGGVTTDASLSALHCLSADLLAQGGIFSLRLTFPETYPEKPPRIRFVSEVFHPNGAQRTAPNQPSFALLTGALSQSSKTATFAWTSSERTGLRRRL